MTSLLIKNGTIVTMDAKRTIIPNGFVQVRENKIARVGHKDEQPNDSGFDQIIDASHMAVLPGLISGHTHVALTPLRGLANGLRLDELARKWLWPYETNLRPRESRVAAQLGCLEMIKAGVTCFADMHFNMKQVAEAVRDSGLRASLSVAMMDQDGVPVDFERSVRENEELVREWNGKAEGHVTCMFGPCTIRTASKELFLRARELATKYRVGLHIHLSEVEDDIRYARRRFRKRPVRYLHDLGVLRSDMLAAHVVWIDGQEMKLLKKDGVKVVHNPSSNAKTSAGIAPVTQMLKAGIVVGLGADAAVCNDTLDMFVEMRTASLLAAATAKPGNHGIQPEKAMEMTTLNNAKALGLAKSVGSLEPGKLADIILVNINQPHFQPVDSSNLLSNLVYCATGRDVVATIVDGRVLMKDRKVLTLNEEQVIHQSNEMLTEILQRSKLDG